MNFYAYVENNPVNLRDPSGKIACGGLCLGGAAILAGGAVGLGVPAVIVEGLEALGIVSPDKAAEFDEGLAATGLAVVGTAAAAPAVVGSVQAAIPYAIAKVPAATIYVMRESERPYRGSTVDNLIRFVQDPLGFADAQLSGLRRLLGYPAGPEAAACTSGSQ